VSVEQSDPLSTTLAADNS